jgi:superfamily I DNA/RNA helicase
MSLSSKQLSIIEQIQSSKTGKFIIKACPGSGKTYTVANLLIEELRSWESSTKGIAVLSFTNKARDEIEAKMAEHMGVKSHLRNPHFIGTFDTFFNQSVFLPFANKSLGLQRKPELVGEPFGVWKGLSVKWSKQLFEHTNYLIDGSFAPLNLLTAGISRTVFDNCKDEIHQMKKRVNQLGYFTQRDATYFSNYILKLKPDITSLLARRYPYVIIDEAQDSSDISMAMIDQLMENGVKKVVIIGDPDQAIYEWNNAKPSLFWDKWNEDGWTQLNLNESFRSSDAICNFVSALSRDTSFVASEDNTVKYLGVKPYLEVCDLSGFSNNPDSTKESIEHIKAKFFTLCNENNIAINSKNVAILCRGRDDVPIIRGGEARRTYIDWKECTLKYTGEKCKAKFCFEVGDYVKAYKYWLTGNVIETKDSFTVNTDDLKEYEVSNGGKRPLMKKCVLELASYTSILNVTIPAWIQSNLTQETGFATLGECMAEEVFQKIIEIQNKDEPFYSTIHGVKGASFEAVLLFLKKKGSTGMQYNTYIAAPTKSLKDDNTEEIRIAYVATSRPRRLLMIAVPSDHYEVWKTGFSVLISG